jgi:hypothetical protein
MAKDLDAHQADGGGDEVAVLVQLVEGRVAPPFEVELDVAGEVEEVL